MADFDFSRYDRVISPMVFYSVDLELIYANSAALRQFPMIVSEHGLQSICDPVQMSHLRNQLREGPASLPVLDTPWVLLFDPVRDASGRIVCVSMCIDSGDLCDSGIVPLRADSELLHLITDEFAKPVAEVLGLLRGLEQKPVVAGNRTLAQAFWQMRRRMVRMSVFMNTARDTLPESALQNAFCNADSALTELRRYFEPLQYHPAGYVPVPMSRDAFVLAVTDVLTALYFRQDADCTVQAAAERTDEGAVVSFRSSHLRSSLDEPCETDLTGISTGLFSVRQRIRSLGGDLRVEYSTRASTCQIDLVFPPLRENGHPIRVEQPSEWNISPTCMLAYEFLMLSVASRG